ncbi:hypothetical protein INR76_01920 [Marixanthomonas sp. SCSIO 43207]|uniref:hypothetical protein n=1 Tax=Marixanthomonas sp. SCSIO 43207 TaxID=2779360 RepID=UPI001CA83593|nr:hypothetical protein [Marixanthomonas sp. SCSIO 43207]UAB81543.1 hypothetical protein INR76_01920 [Marixanthomonas sp. SCSIO 43207]
MGFFSTNQKYQTSKEAKQLKSNAKETNQELESILSTFLTNQDKFDSLSDEILSLSKKIKEKLSENESQELLKLAETVYDLQEEYMNSFRVIASVAEKQRLRAEEADKKYQKIAKKASQKYQQARIA